MISHPQMNMLRSKDNSYVCMHKILQATCRLYTLYKYITKQLLVYGIWCEWSKHELGYKIGRYDIYGNHGHQQLSEGFVAEWLLKLLVSRPERWSTEIWIWVWGIIIQPQGVLIRIPNGELHGWYTLQQDVIYLIGQIPTNLKLIEGTTTYIVVPAI